MQDIKLDITRKNIKYSINFPQDFEELASKLTAQINNRNFILITDENVFCKSEFFQKSHEKHQKIYGKLQEKTLILPAGEQYKNWISIEKILEKAFENNLDRTSLMIAIGGGVIGDMVGFASSIFMRGVPFIQIPTTLLAMVDSSVGGKTGIDSQFGKNLIGAFHQPEAVFCCTHFLQSLPESEIKNGLCEMIKHGIIHDSPPNPHFQKLLELSECVAPLPLGEAGRGLLSEELLSKLTALIADSIAIKKYIVQKDEQEAGIRGYLNLGHTFGHAIELLSEFRIPHGQGVAMGIMKSIEYAEKYGILEDKNLTKKLKKILKNFQITIDHDFSDPEIIAAMRHDKKKKDGKIRLILPQKIGQVIYHNLEKI